MYRGGRQGQVAAALNRGTAILAATGLTPKRLTTLEVRGRRSGQLLSFPVVVTEHDGQRYLVAMLGQSSNWVRNVRAAEGHAALRHRRREQVRLEEVPTSDRAPILKRYLRLAPGARAHFELEKSAPVEDFEKVADRYPVFHIVSA